ncbi:hypothetical protein Poli38472_013525 [Pythium oligandrum]|uniref:Uncharacterized protein n=1 Tax=Pythium oligandrum TaxID=41045 RepID=A0A8K1FD87_PYTOL|nr:hypothetical protein Poli38472_013525 [Pythium oligandrum]|eukprot:TMW58051.1 hypothetical protein Poli38472_013525 [Pythium oligandrum]
MSVVDAQPSPQGYDSVGIAYPKIESIARDALVQWKKARSVYEAEVTEWCRARAMDPAHVMVSVKSTMDPTLLRMCCRLEWKIKLEDITDEVLIERLDAIISSFKNGTLSDYEAVFDAKLKMDLQESDVKARVMKYFCLCEEIVEDEDLASLFSTPEGQREHYQMLITHLSPKELKVSVEEALRSASSEAMENPVELYRVVLAKAMEQNLLYSLRKRAAQPVSAEEEREHHNHVENSLQDSDLHHRGAKRQWEVTSEGTTEAAVHQETQQVAREMEVRVNEEVTMQHSQRLKCFRCGGPHFKIECPKIDETKLALECAFKETLIRSSRLINVSIQLEQKE